MLRDITLGQFFPGDSLLHKIDPRMKILLVILFIAAIFCASSLLSFAVVLLSSLILTAISGISLRQILKGLKPLFLVMLFTAVLNIFWTSGDTLLWEWHFIKIYAEGLWYALFMVVRVVTLIIGSSVLLTYTTSPIALTDGLERILVPLKVIHLPVHEFSMMLTIALRFIPTLIEETDKIISAQKARGADFTSGSLLQRVKSLIPVMVPLFVSAFHRADELAIAMECRCYHGGEGRTRMTQLHLHPLDIVFLLAMIALLVLVIFCNSFVI